MTLPNNILLFSTFFSLNQAPKELAKLEHLILEGYEKENIHICQAIADGGYPIVLPCS